VEQSLKTILVSLIALVSCAAQAQQASAAAGETTTVLRSTTQMVYLPVVVRDKHGAPMRGLTREQFRILQDGREQKIAVFEEISAASIAADAAKFGRSRTAEGYTYNVTESVKEPQRMLAVLIDNVNSSYFDQKHSKDAILKFLIKDLPQDQPVALLMLNSHGLRQLHPFTQKSVVLTEALRRTANELGIDNTQDNGAQLSDTLNSAAQQESAELAAWEALASEQYNAARQKRSARSTLLALEQIAGAYAGIPGRKTIIWMTNGFPFLFDDPMSLIGADTELVELYQNVWRRLEQANIAIYPVSVEGLTTDSRFDSGNRNISRPLSNPSVMRDGIRSTRSSAAPTYNLREERLATLESFANATGGRARYNSNDLEGGMNDAAHESSAYYMVGYYLSADVKPGWRKLKVKVDARDVSVRAREGVFVGQTQNEDARQLELKSAATSPVDFTGIRFAARLMEATDAANGKRKLPVRLAIPADSIKIDADKGNLIDISFICFALDSKGHFVADQQGLLKRGFTPQELAPITAGGIKMQPELPLEPGDYEIRIVLRDNQTGRIGSLRLRTQITAPIAKTDTPATK